MAYSVYNEFRAFSNKDIKRYARDARGEVLLIDESRDVDLKIALDRVWDRTKAKGAVELSEITHLPDSAWDKAFQMDRPLLHSVDRGAESG